MIIRCMACGHRGKLIVWCWNKVVCGWDKKKCRHPSALNSTHCIPGLSETSTCFSAVGNLLLVPFCDKISGTPTFFIFLVTKYLRLRHLSHVLWVTYSGSKPWHTRLIHLYQISSYKSDYFSINFVHTDVL